MRYSSYLKTTKTDTIVAIITVSVTQNGAELTAVVVSVKLSVVVPHNTQCIKHNAQCTIHNAQFTMHKA